MKPTPPVQPNIPSVQHQPPQPQRSLQVVTVVIGVLIVVTAAVLAYLLLRPGGAGAPTASPSPSPTSTAVGEVASQQSGINVAMYQPRRTGSTTTVDFALKNTTGQLVSTSLADAFSYGMRPPQALTYLINSATSANYGPVLTSSGALVSCPVTAAELAAGQSLTCFYEFSDVPADATVSFTSGQFRFDGLVVP